MRALNIFSCYSIKEAPFVYHTKAPINQIFDFWQQIFTFHDFKSSSIGVLSSFVLSVFGTLCEEFGHDSTVLPSLRKHAASNTLFGLWGTPLGVIPLMFVKFWINLRHLITLACKTHKRKYTKMKNCYRDWIEFSAVKDLYKLPCLLPWNLAVPRPCPLLVLKQTLLLLQLFRKAWIPTSQYLHPVLAKQWVECLIIYDHSSTKYFKKDFTSQVPTI